METAGRRAEALPEDPLETSLVEWKLIGEFKDRLRGLPLETSLVEWKPAGRAYECFSNAFLGNFLSGMETPPGRAGDGFGPPPWKLP